MVWSKPRLAAFAVVAMLATAFATTATAATDTSSGWYYGSGTQYFDYGEDLFEVTRTVEAWVSEDGRYRVVVSSPNGATEEFLYDGKTSLMAATPPGEKEPVGVSERESAYLWAVDGHPALSNIEQPAAFADPVYRDIASGLPIAVSHLGSKGTAYELSLTWVEIGADASLLLPSDATQRLLRTRSTAPESEEVPRVEVQGPQTRSVASNSQTFYDNLYTEDACVYGKNYRDAEDSYLRAYSSVRGDCDLIGVTLRHGSQKQGGGGYCQYTGFLVGGTNASYKNYERYTAWNTPTCTSHAGWYNGLQVVPYLGLATIPWND